MAIFAVYLRDTLRSSRAFLQGKAQWSALGVAALGLAALSCAPQPEETPGRPLKIAVHSDPLGLDPHAHNEVLTFSVLRNIYETLTDFGPEMAIQPALAARWENPDDVTWRFVLRSDVLFHDGRRLSSADVVASLERVRRHPRSNLSSYLVEVEEIRAIDAETVEIVTRRPYPILLNKLAFVSIVPADAPATEEIREPIGTGPYRLLSYRPGEALELQAFAEYRAGTAPEPRVDFLPIRDAIERRDLLLAGAVDVIQNPRSEDFEALSVAPCCKPVWHDSLQVVFLSFDISQEPFDDPRVRQAIDLAIDRQALVDDMLLGQGTPLGQMASVNVFGYDPRLEIPQRDVERARALLTEAGYPDGLDLQVEFRFGRDFAAVGRQLAEAGIRVEEIARPWAEMFERLLAGEVAFYLGGVLCVSADASDFFDSMAHSADTELGYGQSNFHRYHNETLDRLIEASGSSLDMLERREILRKAMQLLVADRGFLPLFSNFQLYAARREVEWQPRLDGMLVAYGMHRQPQLRDER